MTDEEVQITYDYLHENYDYVDGDLIVKNDIINGHKKGTKIGIFKFTQKGSPFLRVNFPVGRKTLRLSHAIFIYHKKEKPKTIIYLDGNRTNTRIENLEKKDHFLCNSYENRITKPKGFTKRKESKEGCLTVKVKRNGRQVMIGSFYTEKEAKEAYIYASELWDNNSFTKEQWLQEVRKKYPLQNTNKFIREFIRDFPVGVAPHGDRFRSYISINSKKKHLGVFNTPEEAHQAYLKAREERALARIIQETPEEGKIPKQKIQESVHSLSEAKAAGEKIIDKFSLAINNLRER